MTTQSPDATEQVARADLSRTVYARALFKMRDTLTAVHDELEDEGDRVYLGSTNHAELIHEAWHLADALHWDEILEDTQPKTPLAEVNLRLQAEIVRLGEVLKNPPKHDFWGAGEPDCPREIKVDNGEVHTLRCKVCGRDNPKDDICHAAIAAMQPIKTDAALPSNATTNEADADSGMSGDAVADAEWLWANLPTGNKPWTSLHTHEKALVCHTLARFRSNATTNASLVEALEYAADAMTCQDDDSAHYCPNCDNSSFNARAKIRRALATLRASNPDEEGK